jgi:two-component system OmpR family response regulator
MIGCHTVPVSSRNAPVDVRSSDELRLLIVDDEPRIADVLARTLALEGWRTRTSPDGASAIRAATEFAPHAVVLDLGLPDMSGFTVLARLRELDPSVCVLFLTARDAVEDRIAGIRAGGDDYVTKPFSMEEVAARLRGLVRRAGVTTANFDGAITVGDLVMVEDAREVWRAGEAIDLTATEFELLRFLMFNPRKVLSKTQILAQVWDYDFGGSAHVVELYISYLRKKIDAGRPAMIHTVRGIGYVLKPS